MHHVACTSDDSSPACCLSVRRSFFRWGCACGRKVRGIREKPRPAQSTGTSKTPLSFSPPVPPPRISAPRQTCSSFLYVVRVRRFYFSATCAKVEYASSLLQSLLYAILYRACPAGGMSSMLLPCHCRSSLAIIATGWIGPAPWASEQGSDATLKHYAPTLLLARSAVWVCTVTDLRHVILDKSPLCRNGDAWHERI